MPLLPVEIPNTIRAAEAAGAGVPLARYGSPREAREIKAAYLALATLLFPEPDHAETAPA